MKGTSVLALGSGSRVGVIGGGPAGSFFSYFLLDMAERIGMDLQLDIYESRNFSLSGPAGCNMCAGVISESLVQTLAVEGINLPPEVVQRGIDSYALHTEMGGTIIYTPLDEMRIATVYRGSGPRGVQQVKWSSFDSYLLELAVAKGANLVRSRVSDITRSGEKPEVQIKGEPPQAYDLLVGAVGVNSPSLGLFEKLGFQYRQPKVRRTFITELEFGVEAIKAQFGNSMHIFLLDLSKLDFAGLIPKGDYVTLCLIGTDIDRKFVDSFLNHAAVKECFPAGWTLALNACHCFPKFSIGDALHPFADRVVMIGDSGVTRLNKDGIGAAYRTAKAAAKTAIFEGISAKDFQKHYWPTCQAIRHDNQFGRVVFAVVRLIQKMRYPLHGVLRMVKKEQQRLGSQRRMSMVLWDTFTGSAYYRNIFFRTLHPYFLARFLIETILAMCFPSRRDMNQRGKLMETGRLGKIYHDGEVIVQEGEVGDCMFVIQAGRVEITRRANGEEIRIAVLEAGDIFGEMALFDRETRSATVRALGEARVLSIDKRGFLRGVHEDPSLAFRILRRMSQRIRDLDAEIARLKARHGLQDLQKYL